MDCKIFHDYLGLCNDTLKVYALLEPASSYEWVIVDKFDKEYSGTLISDGEGFLNIPISGLPDGFLTQYSGLFTLRIMRNGQQVTFMVADFYHEICFRVLGGPRVKDYLGVDFACTSTSGGGGNSAVFPFATSATQHIEWSSLLTSLYGNSPIVQVYIETSPGVYELSNVSVTMNQTAYTLDSIDIDLGGTATGYVLLS